MHYRHVESVQPALHRMLWLCAVSILAATAAHAHDADLYSGPADPDAPTRAVIYQPVLEGYEHTKIVRKPQDWRAANDLAEKLKGHVGQLKDRPGN